MLVTTDLGVFKDELKNFYTVLERTALNRFTPVKGQSTITKGSRSYQTKCGIHLNYSGSNSFVTLDGIVLTRK